MQFTFQYTKKDSQQLKYFLLEQGISRRLLAKVKFQGGLITVNQIEQNVLYMLESGDVVSFVVPDEAAQDNVIGVDVPITILYEDEHFLAVDKPAGVASIPSYNHPKYAMANRVKGYLVRQNYANQVIHIVTRLDRDTTGIMLFAKHQLAHAHLDKQLRAGAVHKSYLAITPKQDNLGKHGFMNEKIQRSPESIMIRMVGPQGKEALTEYWEHKRLGAYTMYRIKLHTGRTHQIRVHFSYHHATLVGDDLYGGDMTTCLQRQALHCHQLVFEHPFTKKCITIESSLPEDMHQFLNAFNPTP